MANLLPDLDDFLEQNANFDPVTAEGLDDLIYKIVVHTGLKYEIAKIIVKHYFQEIRNKMLRGEIIYLNNIGKLYIRCRKNGTTKSNQVFPVIKAFKKLNLKIKYIDD